MEQLPWHYFFEADLSAVGVVLMRLILPPLLCSNQIVPARSIIIPSGWALMVLSDNSSTSSVLGLSRPILLPPALPRQPPSVNQTAPSSSSMFEETMLSLVGILNSFQT